jgi:hypothetical protein
MPLERRLRDEFAWQADRAPRSPYESSLLEVVGQAHAVRRRRRQNAGTAAVLLVVLVMVAGVVRSWWPGEQDPTIRPAPAPSFTSVVHGYAVSYPDGWRVLAATRPWRDGLDEGVPGVADRFVSPGTEEIDVWSQAVSRGRSDAQWIADYLPAAGDVAMPTCFPPPARWQPVVVDGHAGGVFGGDYGCSFTAAIVIVDHRAYLI